MIFYLCIALNINILLSSELCWCETTTFFTLLTSHIINRHPTFIHVRPPGVPNEYQQHIYRAPCDCNTLGQMGEVSVRTMEDPSQRIVVCFFASNAERIATEKKNIYIPVFVPRSFCTATWCDHGEFNRLFLFLLLAVFLLPLLSCYNILYLFCSNPTTHRVNRFVFLKVFLFELLTCHIPVIKMTQYITIRDVVTHDKRCLGAVHVSSFRLCLAGASKRLEVL